MALRTFNRRNGPGAGVIDRRTAAWPARSRRQFRSSTAKQSRARPGSSARDCFVASGSSQ